MARRVARTARSNLVSRHARHLAGLWGAEGVALVTTLVQTTYVARTLGPRSYGVAALIISIPAFVFTFLDPQSESAVVRYLAKFRAAEDGARVAALVKTAYLADLALAIAGSAVIALAAGWATRQLVGDPTTSYLVALAAFGLSTAGPSATSRSVLSSFGRYTTISTLSVVASVARNGLTIILVAAGMGVRGVVFGVVLGQVLESLSTYVAARRVLRGETGLTWRSTRARALSPHIGEVLRFMAYTELTTLTTAVTKQADVIFLGLVRGPADVGIYRLASSIAGIAGRIISPLQTVVYPDLARAAAGGNEVEVKRVVRRHLLTIGLPLAALGAAGLPLVGWVVRTAAGDAYGPAAGVCRVIVAGILVSLCTYWLRPFFLATGRVRAFFVLSAVVTLITAPVMFFAADRYGAIGVAAARALGSGLLGTSVALAVLAFRRGPLIAPDARREPGAAPDDPADRPS